MVVAVIMIISTNYGEWVYFALFRAKKGGAVIFCAGLSVFVRYDGEAIVYLVINVRNRDKQNTKHSAISWSKVYCNKEVQITDR